MSKFLLGLLLPGNDGSRQQGACIDAKHQKLEFTQGERIKFKQPDCKDGSKIHANDGEADAAETVLKGDPYQGTCDHIEGPEISEGGDTKGQIQYDRDADNLSNR